MHHTKRLLLSASLLLTALLTSCAQFGYQKAPKTGEVEHVVLIWLKAHGNPAQRDKIVASTKDFQKHIPGIISISTGTVLPSDRPVVDDSFDIALVVRFENKAALANYEKHPVHTKAVTEVLKPLAGKILVYDATVR
ncbi:hypothetical protein BH11VER1_BH11VER1_03630 [soil metagenome]